MLPVELLAALAGHPQPGDWDLMAPLLTVDEAGFPNVCLLSRSELDADDEHVYAVVSGATTVANLRRTGQATLSVVTHTAAIHVKLRVVVALTAGTWLGVVLAPESVKHDGVGVPLTPPRYLATEALATTENWERSQRLLDELRKGAHRGDTVQPA